MYAALIAGILADARLRWYQYPAAQTLVALLLIFPVGIALTILCAVLVERQLTSGAVLAGAFVVLMPFVFLRVLSFWLGRPTLR